jgi:hypothetical protein
MLPADVAGSAGFFVKSAGDAFALQTDATQALVAGFTDGSVRVRGLAHFSAEQTQLALSAHPARFTDFEEPESASGVTVERLR